MLVMTSEIQDLQELLLDFLILVKFLQKTESDYE